MGILAISILLSTILFLVDRNRQWVAFWRFTKSVTILAVFAVIGGATYYFAEHKTPKHTQQGRYTVADIDPAPCAQPITPDPAPTAKK